MNLWMAVTPDEFELPIYIEDTAKALADKLGISMGTVLSSLSRGCTGDRKGRKIVKVVITDERGL